MARKKSYRKLVQQERERLLSKLEYYGDPSKKEYQQTLMALLKLEEIEQKRKTNHVTGDTMAKCATTAGTAIGVALFEQTHSLPSKLLGFIPKLKI